MNDQYRDDVKVSIITVSFNSERTIRRTIESVLSQTYSNIEYIVVDGKSSDHTVEIIKEYEKSFEGRMKWVSEPDQGIYDAMNKGIMMATGELVGIINSDDYYELDAVEKMVNALENKKYMILYGFLRKWKNQEVFSISIRTHKDLRNGMISHPTCFVTMAVYREVSLYDTQYSSVADYDFMLKMFSKKEVYFKPVYQLIANFEMGGMSSTREAWLELERMKKNHGLISPRQYRSIIIKDKLLRVFHRK